MVKVNSEAYTHWYENFYSQSAIKERFGVRMGKVVKSTPKSVWIETIYTTGDIFKPTNTVVKKWTIQSDGTWKSKDDLVYEIEFRLDPLVGFLSNGLTKN